MRETLNVLAQNKEAVTLIFSFVVAVSTVIYAILTWRLTSETIKMRKAQTEPQISVYLHPCQVAFSFFDLVVKNIGSGPAYDIKFQILEEFDVKEGRKLSEVELMKEGIAYMPPSYSIVSFLFGVLGQYNEIIDKTLRIKVSYKNLYRKQIFETIKINMSQFKGRQRLGDDPINTIAKNIENVQKDIHNLASGFYRLRIDTYTAKDREKERMMRTMQKK